MAGEVQFNAYLFSWLEKLRNLLQDYSSVRHFAPSADRPEQGFSVYVSTLTLTIIAIDRYVVIVYPFRARMQASTEERSRSCNL